MTSTVNDEMFGVLFVVLGKVTGAVVLSGWRLEDDDARLSHSANVDVFGPATESFAAIFHHRGEPDDALGFVPTCRRRLCHRQYDAKKIESERMRRNQGRPRQVERRQSKKKNGITAVMMSSPTHKSLKSQRSPRYEE